ncbi:MAG: hypothetical protein J6N52_05470 [Clostridia bacterium]|nr:hypothetical protein [Clostridia bacterium]
MKNSTRKVVILENLTSPYIHQAIIVLNDYDPSKENKVICDAERIVNEYLEKTRYDENDIKIYSGTRQKKAQKKSTLTGTLILLCVAAMFAAGIFILRGV